MKKSENEYYSKRVNRTSSVHVVESEPNDSHTLATDSEPSKNDLKEESDNTDIYSSYTEYHEEEYANFNEFSITDFLKGFLAVSIYFKWKYTMYYLMLPYLIYQCGLILGICLLLFTVVILLHSMYILVSAYFRLGKHVDGPMDLSHVMEAVFYIGPKYLNKSHKAVRTLVRYTVLLHLTTAVLVQTIFAALSAQLVVSDSLGQIPYVVCPVGIGFFVGIWGLASVILPVTLGNTALVIMFITLMINFIQHCSPEATIVIYQFSDLSSNFVAFNMASQAIIITMHLADRMEAPSNLMRPHGGLLASSMMVSLACQLIIGVLGYISFGSSVTPNMMYNLSSGPLTTTAQVCMIISIVCSIPLYLDVLSSYLQYELNCINSSVFLVVLKINLLIFIVLVSGVLPMYELFAQIEALTLAILLFFMPALLDLLLVCYGAEEYNNLNLYFIKNIVIIALGFVHIKGSKNPPGKLLIDSIVNQIVARNQSKETSIGSPSAEVADKLHYLDPNFHSQYEYSNWIL